MNWVSALPPSYTGTFRRAPLFFGRPGAGISREKTAEIGRLLITHCGPVLFGGKPSALFIVGAEKYSLLLDLVVQIDTGVSLLILKKIQKGFLVLLYRSDALFSAITEPDTQKTLAPLGYNPLAPQSSLSVLKSRLCECKEFPHEIGFFLGYPPEDVMGFIRQKGKNYKCRGLWKVYGDVGKAVTLFNHYEICREKTRKYLGARYSP
jgi:hypothetical protein